MNKMTLAEAGRLGALKTIAILREKKRNKIVEYNKSPKLCGFCSKVLPFKQKMNVFCGRSCAVTYNNGKRQSKFVLHFCKNCSKEITTQKVFCSRKCAGLYKRKLTVDKIKNGVYNQSFPGNPAIRNFLIEERGFGCENCGRKKWLGQPIPLNIHHEDGNACNNKPNNIFLYCLNCHGLTPNFGRKNKKSTRKYRYSQ